MPVSKNINKKPHVPQNRNVIKRKTNTAAAVPPAPTNSLGFEECCDHCKIKKPHDLNNCKGNNCNKLNKNKTKDISLTPKNDKAQITLPSTIPQYPSENDGAKYVGNKVLTTSSSCEKTSKYHSRNSDFNNKDHITCIHAIACLHHALDNTYRKNSTIIDTESSCESLSDNDTMSCDEIISSDDETTNRLSTIGAVNEKSGEVDLPKFDDAGVDSNVVTEDLQHEDSCETTSAIIRGFQERNSFTNCDEIVNAVQRNSLNSYEKKVNENGKTDNSNEIAKNVNVKRNSLNCYEKKLNENGKIANSNEIVKNVNVQRNSLNSYEKKLNENGNGKATNGSGKLANENINGKNVNGGKSLENSGFNANKSPNTNNERNANQQMQNNGSTDKSNANYQRANSSRKQTSSGGSEEPENNEYSDPFSNPNNPITITFKDVTSAAFLIKGNVVQTPCSRSHLSEICEMNIYIKKEFLQYTGSFKERGACNAMLKLCKDAKEKGVVTASLGNHAQGVSYNGKKFGIPTTIVMPVVSSIMKIQKCRNYGANVVLKGENMADATQEALRLAKEEGLTFLSAYDHPHVMAGQGTIGLEILEQVPDPDAIVVPVGGGGLIAGIAAAVKGLNPRTKIIGVESDKAPGLSKALESSGPISVPIDLTIADGLAVPKVGTNTYATMSHLIDKMVVVSEEWIALAILRFIELEKCVVEGAGATGLAAILAGHLDEFKGKKVVLVLSGGNIDSTIFGRCVERGLASDGRLVQFVVDVVDKPGGLEELCSLISSLGCTIKDIIQQRAFLKDIYFVEVSVTCETINWDHSLQLKQALTDKYKRVQFTQPPLAIRDKDNSNE